MSDAYEDDLVARETSMYERATSGVVGLGFVSFLLGWASLFEFTPSSGTIAGIDLFTLLASVLVLMGGAVVAFGVASSRDAVDTAPDATAGAVTAVLLGLFGFIGGGLVASQTFGFGDVGAVDFGLFVATVAVLGVHGAASVVSLVRGERRLQTPAGVKWVAASFPLLGTVGGLIAVFALNQEFLGWALMAVLVTAVGIPLTLGANALWRVRAGAAPVDVPDTVTWSAAALVGGSFVGWLGPAYLAFPSVGGIGGRIPGFGLLDVPGDPVLAALAVAPMVVALGSGVRAFREHGSPGGAAVIVAGGAAVGSALALAASQLFSSGAIPVGTGARLAVDMVWLSTLGAVLAVVTVLGVRLAAVLLPGERANDTKGTLVAGVAALIGVMVGGRVATTDLGMGDPGWVVGAVCGAAVGALLAFGMGGLRRALADDGTAATDGTGVSTVGISVAGVVGLAAIALGITTLGYGPLGWVGLALLSAVAVGAAVVLPAEDIGSTLPVGLLVGGLGLAILTGVVDGGWSWQPGGISATFSGQVAVPVFAIVGGLLATWAAAKAHDGFGTRGRQNGAYMLVGLNVFSMLGVLVLLVLWIARRGWDPMTRGAELGLGGTLAMFGVELPFLLVKFPFLTNPSQGLNVDIYGVWPAVVGTVWLVVGAVLLAVPLGVGAAVFLTEFAEQGNFTRIVEIATNGLWSTPSIVFGLFGYAFLVPRLKNQISLLTGMLVLGFMLLPLVLITSREALKSVPDEYRDASAALGVSQWQTIRSVVLPAAMPGVITGVILGVGRIAGETAPILLVTAGTVFPEKAPQIIGSFEFTAAPPFVQNDALLQASSALPYQLYATITAGVGGGLGQPDNIEAFQWATTLLLLVVVLSFYAIGISMRIYFRRKLNQ